MIIADHELTIKKVDEFTLKIIELLKKETVKVDIEDDPAEQIYFVVHVIADLTARMSIILENFSKTYGIEKMDELKITEWIRTVTDEYLELLTINKRL